MGRMTVFSAGTGRTGITGTVGEEIQLLLAKNHQ